MTKPILNVYKPVGTTPFQLIQQFREKKSEYQNITLGYAGRLDPMAEGVLLILVGDENKKRKEYERLEKTYVTEIVSGISTDTYDCMGLVTKVAVPLIVPFSIIHEEIKKMVGTFEQEYPPYSSVLVKGKPLFYWAREGKLDEISIPRKHVSVYEMTTTDIDVVSLEDMYKTIVKNITKVEGAFRQKHIIDTWSHILKQNTLLQCTKITCVVRCSSGTYIRSIAHELGKAIGTGAFAFSIKREAVGSYTISDSIHLTEI